MPSRTEHVHIVAAVGTADDTRELNRRFRERMVELGIAHAWTELAGIGHDPRAVLERLAQVDADFYRQALAPAAPGPRPTSTVTPTVTSPLTSNVTAPGAQASTSPSR